MTNERDELARIRNESEQRKASGQIGGVRAWFEIDFLLRQIDRLEAEKAGIESEKAELEDFQNSIAIRMPEEYDGDWDQESLINKWLDDITKPRTVTTAAELDALPVDSTVRDAHGFVYQKWVDLDEPDLPWWALVGDSRQYPARRITLPATVLHEGATS